MQSCPQCQSKKSTKSGLIKERQRYKCKGCGYHYTVSQKSDTSTKAQRR